MSDADATSEAEPQVDQVDERRQPLLDALSAEFGDALLGSEISGGDICVRVALVDWKGALQFCRDRLGMEYFCFLSGLDWKPAPDLSGEKVFEPAEGVLVENEADEEDEAADALADEAADDEGVASGGPDVMQSGVAGGDARFQVMARVYSVVDKIGITLKADIDENNPEVESIVKVYSGADWHERETWEMLGFQFIGHPGLRHLYLPSEFEGFPLRKDFPLLAREVKPWPGIVDVEPLPGEPAAAGEGEEASQEA